MWQRFTGMRNAKSCYQTQHNIQPMRKKLISIFTVLFSALFFAFTLRLSLPFGLSAGMIWSLLLFAIRDARGLFALGLGFLWGFVVFGLGLIWMWNIFHGFALVLFAILAMFPALFAWMQGIASERGLTGWRWIVFTTLNWCGLEFIRCEIFTLKFPWFSLGSVWGPNVLLPWIGVYGVSALIVASFAVWVSQPQKRSWIFFVLIVAWGSLPLCSLGIETDKTRSIRVAGIQAEEDTTAHYIQKTESLPYDVRYVVWPEYAVPVDVRRDKRTMAALTELCRKRNLTLTFGTQTNHNDPPGWFNTALTMDASGVLGEHHKAHPVHFFNDGTRGTTALPVKTSLGVFGTPICFDCDYEGIVRGMTAAGAEAFVVPTMDAQTWSKLEHDEHSLLFRIRACENARWMLVCASSGVSQIIDANGQVHQELEALTEGVITGRLQRETRLTFYTRYGWLTPWIMLAGATVCWISVMIPKRKKPASA